MIGCLRLTDEAQIPKKAHESDAAFDLCSVVDARLPSGGTVVIGTGIALDLPADVHALVLSRSGLAAKAGVFVLNSPGLIDSGYRGEIKVILHNSGANDFIVSKGDRIAQIMFQPSVAFILDEVFEVAETDRGDYGLGSTGIA